jgi:hypothetical protein
MPSTSYRQWRTVRAAALNEIAVAHAVVGGPAPGRRYTTQQINHAYVLLLASQFQGFCRDLHSECVDHILTILAPSAALTVLLKSELSRGRQLDRGNAQPSSLGADFSRLNINLWDGLQGYDTASENWKEDLGMLNEWRNAIAHQDFTSPKLGAIINLRLAHVRRWRASCQRLARGMDAVMLRHLFNLTGTLPW